MDMRLSVTKVFRRRSRVYGLLFGISLVLMHTFGVFRHPFELDFNTDFKYPLDLENFRDIIEMIKDSKRSKDRQEMVGLNHPLIISIPKPINEYNYRFIIRNQNKCQRSHSKNSFDKTNRSDDNSDLKSMPSEEITLLIVVKSAVEHLEARNAIRKSWGFENRFSDVVIKRVFILGNCVDRSDLNHCQDLIDDEFNAHKDIVQSDFVDSYYNNTIKTLMAFKWTVDYCLSAQFILFADDDYYISIKNLLKYLRNPLSVLPQIDSKSIDSEPNNRFDGRLYTGYVFPHSPPMRHWPSKWYVSLQEYPYHLFPPYVTAGAFVLTNSSVEDMYFASLYTKHFRFDDIYVSLLAKKLSIVPIHNRNFYFWSLPYDPTHYENVIASHGFSDPKHLLISWNQQKSFGFA